MIEQWEGEDPKSRNEGMEDDRTIGEEDPKSRDKGIKV